MIRLRTTGNPNFEHDCTSCVYLGSVNIDSVERNGVEEFDLYVCPKKELGPSRAETLIARFGKDGDYHSGRNFGRRSFEKLPAMVYAGCGAMATVFALAKIYGWIVESEL